MRITGKETFGPSRLKKDSMKILVCVKQVADSESHFEISQDGKNIVCRAPTSYRINSYDEYAIEEALLAAEGSPGSSVEVISIGPDRVKEALRRALSMGAAEAHHLLVEDADLLTPESRARIIADFAAGRSYDLIFTGVMSEDRGGSAVGPMTAELLGMPLATHVMALSIDEENKSIQVEREIDGTRRHQLRLPMPALLTVQSGINRPRYPSLSNVLRAKAQEIPGLLPGGEARPGDFLTRKLTLPPDTRRGVLLQEDSNSMADKLLEYLHSISIL